MALLADVGGAPATGTAPGCGGGGLSLLVPCAAVVGVGAGAYRCCAVVPGAVGAAPGRAGGYGAGLYAAAVVVVVGGGGGGCAAAPVLPGDGGAAVCGVAPSGLAAMGLLVKTWTGIGANAR